MSAKEKISVSFLLKSVVVFFQLDVLLTPRLPPDNMFEGATSFNQPLPWDVGRGIYFVSFHILLECCFCAFGYFDGELAHLF